MKKKYIALAVTTVFLVGIALGSFLIFSNYKSFHIGRALISRSGEFIFVDESGSPIRMGDAAEKQFKGVTDGDKVLVVYGMVLTSYPGQSGTNLCIKLSDGTIDDVNKDAVKQLGELGWLKGEAPFEKLEESSIKSIKLELSETGKTLKEAELTVAQIKEVFTYIKSLEFAHDEGKKYYGESVKVTTELQDGKKEQFTIYMDNNAVLYEGIYYVATPTVFNLQQFFAKVLDLNY